MPSGTTDLYASHLLFRWNKGKIGLKRVSEKGKIFKNLSKKVTFVDKEDLQCVGLFCGGQEGDQNPMI
uniref:Uncharacterized protein n=1 Tax=Echinococcus canadensis TaxID=519352 RepID=A0A915EX67_9CEST